MCGFRIRTIFLLIYVLVQKGSIQPMETFRKSPETVVAVVSNMSSEEEPIYKLMSQRHTAKRQKQTASSFAVISTAPQRGPQPPKPISGQCNSYNINKNTLLIIKFT